MIDNIEQVSRNQVKMIEQKLESCRNQTNNPDSKEYKRAIEEAMENEEAEPIMKYAKISEEQRKHDDSYLNPSSSSSRSYK